MPPEATPRASNACENCRRRKVKCSGDLPCRGCKRHGAECTYASGGRKRYSESYVQDLLDRIQSYEDRIRAAESPLHHDYNSPRVPENEESASGEALPGNIAGFGHRVPAQGPNRGFLDLRENFALPSPDLVQGPAFETQARTLLDKSRQNRVVRRSISSRQSGDADEEETATWQSARALVEIASSFSLPSEVESRRLLDLFLSILGENQHFLDPRNFADAISLLYRSSQSRQKQQSSLWFIQYLLIMAMAKLMDHHPHQSQSPPGADFFAEAMRRLPPLYSLGEHGVVSVEILALNALYLQWCDKKHDAYLHIGVALRLAIALACHLPVDDQDCLPSEAVHRLRLWWTVFMLDRRLSAGLGLPVGADERQIRTELPQAAAGFPSHIPIQINVRIARATGEIMTSLYGNATMSQANLVQKVQDILQSLYDTGRRIPPEFDIDFSRPRLQVKRTAASLYLMLFQAIILCIRPIVLQSVRQHVQQSQDQPESSRTPVIERLCQTCDEAARKSLRILSALQQKGEIPRFGFFDLDATFAAAFLLVMLCSIDEKPASRPPKELKMACEVLRYLARAGNKAAERRLQDILQFCSHVWPDLRMDSLGDTFRASHTGGNPVSGGSSSTTDLQAPANVGNLHTSPDGHSDLSTTENTVQWSGMAQFDTSAINFDLGTEADDIYTSFYNPEFPLTGVDHADWLEMERFFAEQQ